MRGGSWLFAFEGVNECMHCFLSRGFWDGDDTQVYSGFGVDSTDTVWCLSILLLDVQRFLCRTRKGGLESFHG
jgi:hypothetical protein